jgi:hypothetical protein
MLLFFEELDDTPRVAAEWFAFHELHNGAVRKKKSKYIS